MIAHPAFFVLSSLAMFIGLCCLGALAFVYLERTAEAALLYRLRTAMGSTLEPTPCFHVSCLRLPCVQPTFFPPFPRVNGPGNCPFVPENAASASDGTSAARFDPSNCIPDYKTAVYFCVVSLSYAAVCVSVCVWRVVCGVWCVVCGCIFQGYVSFSHPFYFLESILRSTIGAAADRNSHARV